MLLADDGVQITSKTILADDGVEITWDMILADDGVEITSETILADDGVEITWDRILADDGVEITSETILADDGVEITWDRILADHVVEIRLSTWHLPGKRNQPTSAPGSVPRHSHPILHGKTSPGHNTAITPAPSFIEKASTNLAATCSALILADDGVEITSEKIMVLTLPGVPCILAGKTDCFHIQTQYNACT